MAELQQRSKRGPGPGLWALPTLQIAAGLLLAIVLLAFLHRLFVDTPNIAAGRVPAEEFDRRYAAHPWLAYLHIAPGALYMVLAPLQLSYRFRHRHYTFHRRLGRLLAGSAMISGVFALVFGGL